MDNSQYTPGTLIPPIDRILASNMKQSVGLTSGYNETNPELSKPGGRMIRNNSDGKVFNINPQGIATWFPDQNVYNQTSGQRGVPGSGDYSADGSSIPNLPYVLNQNVMGFDENSKLYVNGSVRPGQSQGDEASNMFAGVKTTSNFDYKGCSTIPLDGTYLLGGDAKELIILDASYGPNCGNASGNRTQLVQDFVSQHPDYTTYSIGRNAMDFGDPFFGCNKDMSITYKCNGKTNTIVRADGQFDSGAPLDLTCNTQATPSREFDILDASYGSNCGNASSNRTQSVKNYISQHPNNTTYSIGRNVMDFGDPFPGCNKQMSLTYKCNGETKTVVRTDGKFDSGYPLEDITCELQVSKGPQMSLTKCYYDALAKGLSFFGLGNVDSNTNMGSCYAGDSSILNNWWQNPGIPIWKIDMRNAFNYQGNSITNFFLGRNNNAYFSENGIHTEGDWSFYQLCKAGKLPNADPSNANAFASDWNDDTRAMFLANGNLYFFSFPVSMTLPSDLRENPQNYAQYMIYSSGTQGNTMNVGWTDRDILSGVDDNMLIANPNLLGSLAIGQSIYSTDGKLRLKFNTDYTLVLYTGDPNTVGCKTDIANNHMGYNGIAVNQIHNMNTDGEKNFGKVAYVNRLGTAYEYTDPSLIHYTDKYTTNPGYTINNIDSNKYATKVNDGFFYDGSPSSIERCQMMCSKSGNCVGTVIDNGNCYMLSKINNDDIVYKDTTPVNTYIKYPNNYNPGGDIGQSPYWVKSADECLTNCNNVSGCNSIEYQSGNGACFTKSYNDTSHLNPGNGADTYIRSTVPIQPVSNLRIPEINKEGQPSYTVYTNNTLPGGDLGATTTNTANECLDICNKTEGCYSIEFDKGDVGMCYPKSYKEPTTLSPSDHADVYIRNPEKIENPMETTYTKYQQKGINGYDIGSPSFPTPTAKDCMKGCSERDDCAGLEYWSWNGYCFLKSKDGPPHIAGGDGDVYLKNSAPVGTSYLIPPNVNVVDPNKFANYNISVSPMTNTTHDVSLMPDSIANNFLLTSSQLKDPNDKIVRETDRIIRESFTSTEIYKANDKNLAKLKDRLDNYMVQNPKLPPNIITLNKMVSNSSIQMRYLNIVYSILFIIVCILLVVAFTISL
jgi:hypothetical protein